MSKNTMKTLISAIEARERRLDDAEQIGRRLDLAQLSDLDLRTLQVKAILERPEAERSNYDRFCLLEYEREKRLTKVDLLGVSDEAEG